MPLSTLNFSVEGNVTFSEVLIQDLCNQDNILRKYTKSAPNLTVFNFQVQHQCQKSKPEERLKHCHFLQEIQVQGVENERQWVQDKEKDENGCRVIASKMTQALVEQEAYYLYM